ncbi:MAG TPA: hypothetical protein VGQ65_08835 [Thermoanaerobaculia bacterium]|nr:hypothetical protein [Thermoanaerobaculia bacterium]
MRETVTEPRLRAFMRAIAADAREAVRIYLTGGASAVLKRWRESTLAIDIAVIPGSDRILRAIPHIKERLHVNVELASPADFVPAFPGWRTGARSLPGKGSSTSITSISRRRRFRSSNVRTTKISSTSTRWCAMVSSSRSAC